MANYSPRWFSVTVEQDRVGQLAIDRLDAVGGRADIEPGGDQRRRFRVGQHPLHLPLEDDGVGDDATLVVPGLGPDRFLSMTYIGLVRHTHETGGIL